MFVDMQRNRESQRGGEFRLFQFQPAWTLHCLLRLQNVPYVVENTGSDQSIGAKVPLLIDGCSLMTEREAIEYFVDNTNDKILLNHLHTELVIVFHQLITLNEDYQKKGMANTVLGLSLPHRLLTSIYLSLRVPDATSNGSVEIMAVEHAVNLLVSKLSATYKEIDTLLGLHDGYLRPSTTTTSSDINTTQTTPSAATRSISSHSIRRGAADAVLFGHLMEATSHPLLRVLLDQRPHLQSFWRKILHSYFLAPHSLSPPSWHTALQVLVSNRLFLLAMDEGPTKASLVNAAMNHATILSVGPEKKINKSATSGIAGVKDKTEIPGVNDNFAVTDIYASGEESFASDVGVGDVLRVHGVGSPMKSPAPANSTLGTTSKIPASREVKQQSSVARSLLSPSSPSSSPSSSSAATSLLPMVRDEPTALCRALYLVVPLFSVKSISTNSIVLPSLPTPSTIFVAKPKEKITASMTTNDEILSIREKQQPEAVVRWLLLGYDDSLLSVDKDNTTTIPLDKVLNSTIPGNKSEVAEVSLAGGLFALTAVSLFVREVVLALLFSS